MNTPRNKIEQSAKNLSVGSRVTIDGREWECTNTSAGINKSMRLREVIGSNTMVLPHEHLQELFEEQRLEITRAVEKAQSYATHLHNLTAPERRDFERKCAGVTILIDTQGCSRKLAVDQFNTFCRRQNQQFLEQHKINPKPAQNLATVRKWLNKYYEFGNFLCFIKKDHRTAYRRAQFSEEIENLVHKTIMTSYAGEKKPKMTRAYRTLIRMAQAELNVSLSEAKGLLPSYRTFVRRINTSDHYAVMQARHGKQAVRRRTGYGRKTGFPPHIGGRVEIDCYRVDTMIFDEAIGTTYRPWLMTMIDIHTRCIIGWDLSMTAPSAAKMIRVLSRAVGADDYPFRVIPSVIVVDNGAEFINGSLSDQCSVLGIRIEFAPPRSPKGKPHVERFYRTGNEGFFHCIAGTTFSNPEDRGDYDSEANAIYDLATLNLRYRQFLDVYHQQYHRGIEDTPKNAWNCAASIPELAPRTLSLTDAEVIGTKVVNVAITNATVRYKNLKWWAPSLPELDLNMRANASQQQGKNKSPTVQLRYNPNNLTYAFVCDPRDPKNPIQCDPDKENYQTGLTMDVHEFLMSNINTRRKVLENDESALRVRIELEQVLEDDEAHGRHTKRKRAQLASSARQSSRANPSLLTAADIADEELSSHAENLLSHLSDDFNPENDDVESY
ncbi:MAG: putative transposase [Pseudohongiellaceae bacterium]|jgi:putative transposase